VRVAIVAPTLSILGGHSVQARLLLVGWAQDTEVRAWLVPINPMPGGPIRHLMRVRYARTLLTQLLYWPLLVRQIAGADLVHVFSAGYTSFLLAPLPAMAVARALGRPVVLNYHSGEGPDHLRSSPLARAMLRRVDAVVVPSRFLADAFRHFDIESIVVPNMVDVSRFRPRPPHPSHATFLSTRNLDPLYNVGCTLRAFALVQRRHAEASLIVAGAGSQEGALQSLAAHLGLSNVRFLGRVQPDAMPDVYAMGDIYVQTPDIDNMPLSILEAFATGIPVVSTRAGGVGTLVADGVNGLLAPTGDTNRVADAMMHVLEDPALAQRLATAGYHTCQSFVPAAVLPKWRAVYRNVMPASGRRVPARRTA
jgi:L-malate glycosyltransferase